MNVRQVLHWLCRVGIPHYQIGFWCGFGGDQPLSILRNGCTDDIGDVALQKRLRLSTGRANDADITRGVEVACLAADGQIEDGHVGTHANRPAERQA